MNFWLLLKSGKSPSSKDTGYAFAAEKLGEYSASVPLLFACSSSSSFARNSFGHATRAFNFYSPWLTAAYPSYTYTRREEKEKRTARAGATFESVLPARINHRVSVVALSRARAPERSIAAADTMQLFVINAEAHFFPKTNASAPEIYANSSISLSLNVYVGE